jgi:YidC/Oxa1 family membrane protein insertase
MTKPQGSGCQSRVVMLLLFLPLWGFMMYMMTKSRKGAEEEAALQQAQVTTVSPVDEIIAERDLRKRIEGLDAYLSISDRRVGPEGQRAQIHLAIAHELRGRERQEAGDTDYWVELQNAAETYKAFSREHRGSPWAPHATYWAGRLYGETPRGEKDMVKLLGGLSFESRTVWIPVEEAPDYVEDPETEGMWTGQRALIVAGRAVQPHIKDTFRYKLLDTLVRWCGGPDLAISYVLALVLIALLVKIVTLPLTIKGHIAMKTMQVKMAAVQPEIEEMKKRHKGDQMRIMQEQSRMMKERGISMTGGCLPQLIQLPFIFYLYYAIRIYAHHFSNGSFFWVEDLSKPDLPLLIIYAVSMIVSTKLMPQPATADPSQKSSQKMMTYLMPVMLFFFLRSFPSAFIFYWASFNIIGTIQQLWLNKRFPPPSIEEVTASGPKPARVPPKDRAAAIPGPTKANSAADDEAKPSGLLARWMGDRNQESNDAKPGPEQERKHKPVRPRGKTRKTRRRKPPAGPDLPSPRMK